MMKLNKKILVITGTLVLAVGVTAIPALAKPAQGDGWIGQMMNSSAVQNLHNSQGMQEAMKTGDVKKMQELMNSDQELKDQLGQETIDQMNAMMNGAQGAMHSGQNLEQMNQMHQAMHGVTGNTSGGPAGMMQNSLK